MAPHDSRIEPYTRPFRAWWQPKIFNDKVLHYYNNFVAPPDHLPYSYILTKAILTKTLLAIKSPNFFAMNHHFVTTTRYYVTSPDTSILPRILCSYCSEHNTSNETIAQFPGDDHLTFTNFMVFAIVEIHSLWCESCQIQLFKWYAPRECTICSPQ